MASFEHWDVRLARPELAKLLAALCGGDRRGWLDDDGFAVEDEERVLASGRVTPAPGGMRVDVSFPDRERGLLAWLDGDTTPHPLIDAMRRAFDGAHKLRIRQAAMAKSFAEPRPVPRGREYFGRGTLLAELAVAGCGRLTFEPGLKTNDELWARAWLSPPIIAELRALEAEVDFHLANGVLKMSQGAPFASDERRQRAEALARTIAGRGRALLAEWQAAAAALEGRLRTGSEVWTDDGSTAIEVTRMPATIVIDGWRAPGETAPLHTRLRCRRLSVERVELVVRRSGDLFTIDGAKEFLTPRLMQRIEGSNPEHIAVDRERVTLLLEGFESAAGRLSAACDLVAALATNDSQGMSLGPYR